MDTLKNKKYQSYDYTSRYTPVPYYYNSQDEKYIYGIGTNMFKNTPYTLHTVKDSDTLDSLSLKYYNNPTFYWVIAYFNDIQDCYIRLVDEFKTIKIPSIASINFGNERS